MEWSQIVPYIFGFMALSIAGWIGKTLGDVGASMKSMEQSVGELNLKVAIVVERDQVRGDDVKDLKMRVYRLEERE